MKKLILLTIMAATVSLTSCLKDGPVNLAPGASPMVVQWETAALDIAPSNAVSSSYRTFTVAFPIATAVTMNLEVDITGTDAAAQDITVGLGVSTAAYNTYTSGGSTTNPLLPAADYTMPTSVVIPKGLRTATVPVVLNTTLFDVTKAYFLPVSITSTTAGAVSGNYGTVIFQIAAKNKYDGIWNMTGTLVDLSTATITGKYPLKVYLETTSATAVAMYDYQVAGTFGHAILSSGSNSYYGSFSPTFNFDANNNITSVVNYAGYGQPASNGRYGQLDPTGTNKFTTGTPGTVGAVFQCSYGMYQPSVIAVGPRTTFNETFTYVGPRP